MFNELEIAMEKVQDCSEHNGYMYNLSDMLLVMVCGLLSNLEDIDTIYDWTQSKHVQKFLEEEFNICKMPCRAQFYNILSAVNYEAFNEYFTEWICGILQPNIENKTIAIDGKTICSTEKLSSNGKALHIASAIIAESGFVLASKECNTKTDEINAFRELVQYLKVKNTIIAGDALHTRTKTAEAIIEAGADYLLSVKNNNPHLRENVELFSYNHKTDTASKEEKTAGRVEKRTAYVANNIENFCDKDKWKNLACVGSIHREVDIKGKKTSEWHYYICSKNLSAAELLYHARLEWQVETMHWLLDVHFLEDKTKIFDMNMQKTMNLLRKVVLNLVRKYKESQPKNTALSKILKRNLFDTDNLHNFLQYLRECDM